LNLINEIHCDEKLVAQTYDDATVMAVLQKYEAAVFVHCYAHQLNFVLRQLNLFRSAKFSLVRLLVSQYFLFNQRLPAFDKLVTRRLPQFSPSDDFTQKKVD
jgi:hypothetical protein